MENSVNELLAHIILSYFRAGLSREQAVAKLVKEHLIENRGVRVNCHDVWFWYDSFEKGNFDWTQEPRYPLFARLENLPVLDQIIHLLNVDDQTSLLQTNDRIRNFIERENRLYEKITICIQPNSISLKVKCARTKNKTKLIFARKRDGCDIVQNGVTTISAQDYLKAALEQFQKTVEKKHTKIKELVIANTRRVIEADRTRLLSGLSLILAGLTSHLHVERFSIGVRFANELDSILQYLKQGPLTSFEYGIVRNTDLDVGEEYVDMLKLSESSSFKLHLPYFEHVYSPCGKVDLRIDSFSHIRSVMVELNEVTPEELLTHKNKLLMFDQPLSQCFIIDHTEQDMEAWKTSLGLDFTPKPTNPRELIAKIPFPGDANSVFKVELGRWITFRKHFERFVNI